MIESDLLIAWRATGMYGHVCLEVQPLRFRCVSDAMVHKMTVNCMFCQHAVVTVSRTISGFAATAVL